MKQAIRKNQTSSSSMIPNLNRRVREGVLILSAGIAIFLLLALLTYHAADPGWSHTSKMTKVANAGGRVGAVFADLLLYLIGYMAYVLPLMLLYAAWVYYKNRGEPISEYKYYFLSLKIAGFILILTTGCSLASLHIVASHRFVSFTAGGILGNAIGLGMASVLNIVGASLILFALFLCGITLFTGLSWLKLADEVGHYTFVFSSAVINFYQQKRKTIFSKKSFNENVPDIDDEDLHESRAKLSSRTPIKIEPKLHIGPRVDTEDFDEPQTSAEPMFRKPVVVKPQKIVSSQRVEQERQTNLFNTELVGTLPPLSLLDLPDRTKIRSYTHQQLEEMSRLVEVRLQDFGVGVKVVAVHPGPVVTRFELQLAAGTKVSKISTLVKDLARSLSVISVRVVEVIPGKSVIGLELPNIDRETVRLREILSSQQFESARSPLTLALGKDIAGHPVIVDLAKMPHLLVAGTTGSGKSVGLNAMLLSLLFKTTPDQLRMILIDPKMLELSIYEGIPHLLTNVVTDMKDAANALRWCVAEMDRRYRLMASLGVRNLVGYNQKIKEAIKNGAPLLDPLWQAGQGDKPDELTELPFIMVLVDEFADMMMVVGKKVEELIARIAQKARAAGIHLILATQRPSVDVITGLIKANIPTRISFQVSSRIDSRTILDQQGAEQLLGHGDMLYLAPGTGVPVRVHGAYVADEEVHRVVEDVKRRGQPQYLEEITAPSGESGFEGSSGGFEGGTDDGEKDPLYDQAVQIVLETRRASISNIQRRLKIGYNRAATIIETMEKAGLVSPMESNGSREVLAPSAVDQD